MDIFYNQMVHRTYRQILNSFDNPLKKLSPSEKASFLSQFENYFTDLINPLLRLYSNQADFYKHFEALCLILLESWKTRPAYLKQFDITRLDNPNWFQSNNMIGAVCYVDLFNTNLAGVKQKIPYLNSLGVTYLHLMPLFKAPENENDGGYAVSSYREVNAALGSVEELALLAKTLKDQGISLVLDFINNHTSDEHEWAKAAKTGHEIYKEFYYIFPDKSIPNQFEAHLRQIFPEIRDGNFTWVEEVNGWVWTTFHNYQWDLNYQNPAVFTAMVKEMLFLANLGVNVLRLDAVPFVWKKLGTNCENLPEVHEIIKAFNACARIAAPSLLFKSEAIVHPDDVSSYIHPNQCQLSYNPTVMALLWESLATRKVALLKESIAHRFNIHAETAWVNYVRSHDDIGWTFSDEDASNVGINGTDHRHFLNRFYSGNFEGGFASGLSFQFNPSDGDMRICGTSASLAGLEKAIALQDEGCINDSIQRLVLIYGVCMSLGGIPLLYLGDEIGSLNDYSFNKIKGKKHDNRWVHRFSHNWALTEAAIEGKGIGAKVYNQLVHLINCRKKIKAFTVGNIQLVETSSPSLLAYIRYVENEKVLVMANFSEHKANATIDNNIKLSKETVTELISNCQLSKDKIATLKGYEIRWISL